ncbi:uncharacterized protein LOC132710798 [Pantherophis guttatus]|uniref:Uncharacterized protein LOC132710798 n=1 Tax=Pantherophis guttatus TaxID=94885 RepID=A0ABM3Z6G8_PANGU|nr:uncharacterized protein LOC132710798 [Pantherophis guttatus]
MWIRIFRLLGLEEDMENDRDPFERERRIGPQLNLCGGTQTGILDESSSGINCLIILSLFLVAGPRRLEASLLLALLLTLPLLGPPRFEGANEAPRGLDLKVELGLSLISAQGGFQCEARFQIQPDIPPVGGPRRLEASLLLALLLTLPLLGPPRFEGANEAPRGLDLKVQLGLSLVSAPDGFKCATSLQFQTENPPVGGQGGSLLPWNFHVLWQG